MRFARRRSVHRHLPSGRRPRGHGEPLRRVRPIERMVERDFRRWVVDPAPPHREGRVAAAVSARRAWSTRARHDARATEGTGHGCVRRLARPGRRPHRRVPHGQRRAGPVRPLQECGVDGVRGERLHDGRRDAPVRTVAAQASTAEVELLPTTSACRWPSNGAAYPEAGA